MFGQQPTFAVPTSPRRGTASQIPKNQLYIPSLSWHPDARPLVATPYDDECDGTRGAGWFWFNKDNATVDYKGGARFTHTGTTNAYNFPLYLQNLPSGTPWTFATKVSLTSQPSLASNDSIGILVSNPTTGAFFLLRISVVGAANNWYVDNWTNVTTFGGVQNLGALTGIFPTIYLRWRYDGVTTLTPDISYDGVGWFTLGATKTWNSGYTRIGMTATNIFVTRAHTSTMHWFRRTA